MRVALVCEQVFAPIPGGTGRFTAELLKALRRLADPDDSVTPWSAWHRLSGRDEVPLGLKRLALPRRPLIAAWERGMPPVPRSCDVVHAPTLLVPASARPAVVTIHDAVPWTHPETLTSRGVRWHRTMAARVVERGALVTVPTHAVAAELAAVLPGLPAERIRVIGAGVTADLTGDLTAGVIAQTVESLGLPERYLLSLATLEPRKGLDVLLAALAELGDRAPTLLLVGQNGWGGVDVAASAASLGLAADRIRLTGRITDQQLSVVLRRATALVVPSRAEGFGLPVVEAMAAGTPVIASDAPALVEVAGDAAEIVPREDSSALAARIETVFGDEARRRELSAAGRGRAKAFTWDEVARRCWALYREIA